MNDYRTLKEIFSEEARRRRARRRALMLLCMTLLGLMCWGAVGYWVYAGMPSLWEQVQQERRHQERLEMDRERNFQLRQDQQRRPCP